MLIPLIETSFLLFSYDTVVKRWPVILAGIIDVVSSVNHDLAVSLSDLPSENEGALAGREKIEEGKKIIDKISTIKNAMTGDNALL